MRVIISKKNLGSPSGIIGGEDASCSLVSNYALCVHFNIKMANCFYRNRKESEKLVHELISTIGSGSEGRTRILPEAQIQSDSIIVESIIVENSILVDNLASTEDFYLIKI